MYKEMKKIYDDSGNISLFSMAVAYLIDKGSDNVSKITEDQILTLKGNGLMMAEFEQDLVRTAVKLANVIKNNPVALVKFCEVEDVFDIEVFTKE
jgi:hypothetical protein